MSEEELIETLKEFEKNRVEQLKEPSKNLFYAIMKIADERDKYKEVLDKIKEYLEELLSDTKGIINDYNYHKEEHIRELELLQDDEKIFNKILELLEEIE